MATILILDDEESVARTLSRTLESRGYQTVTAGDGKEGLRRFQERRPDLVITDILMPEAEGLETIRAMRRIDPRMPIIAISGGAHSSGLSVLAIAEKFGADAVMQKPFRATELLAQVERLLQPPRAET